jgi:CheY-like chemotaxis protein
VKKYNYDEYKMSESIRILLVDDDPEVRDLVATVLEEAEIQVVRAADGSEALLRMLEEGPFDVLVTDLRMPGIDGFELARRVRQSRPETRVLFMSGYASEYHIDPERDDFIGKPFRPRELLGCVYEIMGRGTGGQPRPTPP